MRVVIDGLPIRGMSLAIVVEHLLEGWVRIGSGDELHLVLGPDAELNVPAEVVVHRVRFGKRHALSRLWAQSVLVPRLCRRLGADVMLGVLPTTAVTPLPCPRAIIAYDLRHEYRPEQFSMPARLLRTVSYSVGFRQAAAIACISERTRQDLLRSRPWLAGRPVRVALLGADHVDSWPWLAGGEPYAIAFGQYGNKNVELAIEAWSLLNRGGDVMPLVIVGLGASARAAAQASAERRGLRGLVTVLPWLAEEQFRERFASASLVVFPSDFEGFGLPVVEAMRLGIAVVITPEPALLEVSGGHATVATGWDARALADAVAAAREWPGDTAAAREHAATFTWARTAEHIRTTLAEVLRPAERKRRQRIP